MPETARSVSLPVETMLLVDSGYSHTTVTPLIRGRPVNAAVRRLDIGGKFLTNFLKELVSIRHYSMMDETYIMNKVKEEVCYVSMDFKNDIERTWKGGQRDRRSVAETGKDIVVDYILP